MNLALEAEAYDPGSCIDVVSRFAALMAFPHSARFVGNLEPDASDDAMFSTKVEVEVKTKLE